MNIFQTAALNSIIRISYYTYRYLYGSLICVGIRPSYWEALGISIRLLGRQVRCLMTILIHCLIILPSFYCFE